MSSFRHNAVAIIHRHAVADVPATAVQPETIFAMVRAFP